MLGSRARVLTWQGTMARLVSRVAQGSPGPQPPSLAQPGLSGAEAVVAGLCHHGLPSS